MNTTVHPRPHSFATSPSSSEADLVSRPGNAARWFFASALTAVVAVPVVTLLHEFGHFLAATLFGFRDVAIHFESVSYFGNQSFWTMIMAGDRLHAAAVYPLWKIALLEAAGPAMSLAITLLCAIFARKFRQLAVVALVANLRLIAPLAFLAITWLRTHLGRSGATRPGMDEFNFWLLTNVPVVVSFVVEFTIAAAGAALAMRSVPQGRRLWSLAGALSGVCLGVPCYFALGRWLLP